MDLDYFSTILTFFRTFKGAGSELQVQINTLCFLPFHRQFRLTSTNTSSNYTNSLSHSDSFQWSTIRSDKQRAFVVALIRGDRWYFFTSISLFSTCPNHSRFRSDNVRFWILVSIFTQLYIHVYRSRLSFARVHTFAHFESVIFARFNFDRTTGKQSL